MSLRVVTSRKAAYASTPGVVGWTAWTWKRSGTGNPTPEELTPPPAWRSVIQWITAPTLFSMPTAESTRPAMAAFLESVSLSACKEDMAFVAATE